MAMTGRGLAQAIIRALRAVVPGLDLNASVGQIRIDDLSDAIVREIKTATVRVDLESVGAATNTAMTPGTYTGTGTVTAGGAIDGFSGSAVAGALKRRWNIDAVAPPAVRRDCRRTIDALCSAIGGEISDQGRCTGTTTDTGVAPAGGGPVAQGRGAGAGTLTSLDATRLKRRIQRAIDNALDGVDFTQGSADETIGALAAGLVDYIHANAEVTLTTTLDVRCQPSPGPASGTGRETRGPIS